jgi:protein-L-isoaspartate(D-aspartate) O-methyltransferase
MPAWDWQPRARDLVEHLAATGALSDPAWRRAFEQTPRHVFVPAFQPVRPDPAAGPVISAEDPDGGQAWLEAVYRDDALLTQHHATGDGTVTGVPTSSSSWPSAMAVMLDRLQINDGDTVLGIGTGTGYNAALLCHRLGDHHVTSIDIDPTLVAEARDRLASLGHHPTLIAADGADGAPAMAPFDAIIATCAVAHIPPAWIAQLKPGGRIVTPFGATGGALATLTKTEPDAAQGPFDAFPVYFMPLRPRSDSPSGPLSLFGLPAVDTPVPYEGLTDLNPRDVLIPDFQLWLELHLAPYTAALTEPDAYEAATLLLITAEGYARVATTPQSHGTYLVRQYGRRRPWDTVETAWHAWHLLGRPPRTRLGIWASTTINEQYVWLDTPTSDISWPMPAYGVPAAR